MTTHPTPKPPLAQVMGLRRDPYGNWPAVDEADMIAWLTHRRWATYEYRTRDAVFEGVALAYIDNALTDIDAPADVVAQIRARLAAALERPPTPPAPFPLILFGFNPDTPHVPRFVPANTHPEALEVTVRAIAKATPNPQ